MQVNDEERDTLLAEVNDISDEVLNQRPDEKNWSIKQVLEHLFLMEGAIVKTIEDQLANGEEADTEPKPIELTVNREQKVEAPGFATPTDDFATLEEVKLKLAASHNGLLKLVEKADPGNLARKAFPHPVFGSMSLKQWIPFIGWHEKRHTLQIREVKEALGLS
jgi:hypothetical protein